MMVKKSSTSGLLETGTYAESYKHIAEIRMLLEEGLPELVCMAAKCEQIPELMYLFRALLVENDIRFSVQGGIVE